MKSLKSFNSKCYELAVFFTEDAPVGRYSGEDVNELALVIQQAIEDFLSAMEDEE